MAKDPTRQNIYESTAIDIISAFDSQLVSRFEKLTGGGSNAIYIQGRALRTGAPLIEDSSKETKSIDFRWWITDRKSVVKGKRVSVRLDFGGSVSSIKKISKKN